MTWVLTVGALALFIFRKAISRRLAPYFPDRKTRHAFLGIVITAFAIAAVVRLGVRYWG
jgi:hypothetical protein